MAHLRSLLVAARRAADVVGGGGAALVHCSDGWDRTPQIVALAQILLDPHFRTIAGFEALVRGGGGGR
jgi:protein tyrosine phosphatase